ncbi:hypothetical protein GH714_036076 [Hevea brasiliensis]|uniref:Alpha/beta hydrolase fold-3 domain-containing protein n=1 Tax=Hevea brasiliensis TaxID=3981 RepID=A0A6A6N8R1_HEVBR|nr:hypothetical protein GH714_036076 [Hevea brasiliensis]
MTANIIIVSVDYRKAPEHHLPVAYDDSWTVLKWVASQVDGDGSEEWLNCYADLKSVFLAGDSAGGNIAHRMAMKYEEEKLSGINLAGIVLIHPYFWGKEPIGNEVRESKVRSMIDGFWHSAYPATSGCDDPLLNPATDPKFGSLGCSRVLIFLLRRTF